jgi:hypothetical protein
MSRPVDIFHQRALDDEAPKVATPVVGSFREFLEKHARVKTPDGSYAPYTFSGREALEFVVGIIDRVLGNNDGREPTPVSPPRRGTDAGAGGGDWRDVTRVSPLRRGADADTSSVHFSPPPEGIKGVGHPISDARLTATGSAQWGKTLLELNLLAYLTGLQFRSVGLFLPDEDLVEGVVDSKFRPDVLDQLPWLNSLITLGKAENASGKTVNRKGLFTCTDGRKRSHGMVHGMRKIPTTFSFDVVIEDEKDDIPPSMSRYLTARMTASDLRFRLSIGTQRYAGAGQNKEFEAGTMHVGYFTCPKCGHQQNPEENWPGICRLAVDGEPKADDPQLQLEGNFRKAVTLSGAEGGVEGSPARREILRFAQNDKQETVFDFAPDAHFYLACVRCGAELDRRAPEFIAQHPEREKLHHWSVRISQLLVAAISLKQIVSDWCHNAVKDPDAMKTFSVDRLGLPRSATQQIDQKILDRARSSEVFDLSLTPRPGTVRYAGLDTGDRCWLTVREVEAGTATERRGYNDTNGAETTGGRRPPLQGTWRTAKRRSRQRMSGQASRRTPKEGTVMNCSSKDAQQRVPTGGRRGRQALKLPNEANFSGCCMMWIGLGDNELGVEVYHFVTWLRFGCLGADTTQNRLSGCCCSVPARERSGLVPVGGQGCWVTFRCMNLAVAGGMGLAASLALIVSVTPLLVITVEMMPLVLHWPPGLLAASAL